MDPDSRGREKKKENRKEIWVLGFGLGKEEREREKRDGEKIKEKTEEKANRLQPVSLLHPTAQIFSNCLRISNGLKALEGPSLRLLQMGPK